MYQFVYTVRAFIILLLFVPSNYFGHASFHMCLYPYILLHILNSQPHNRDFQYLYTCQISKKPLYGLQFTMKYVTVTAPPADNVYV
jgi:hypothetical protein